MTLDQLPRYDVPLSAAARQFHVSAATLRRLAEAGELPHARIGKTIRLCVDDLRKLIHA